MAISKIGSRGVIDGSVLAADFAPGTITNAKLAGSIENSKLSNSTFTIGGESIALGDTDNALNLTDWQSKITSDGSTVTTMLSGRGYFVDNSSAAGLVKLPASASRGDFVQIKDYAGNFGTNNLTIQRNSHNIQGQAVDSTIETNRASVTLVYVDSTKGWLYIGESNVADLQNTKYVTATGGTVATSGDFKIHSFTGDGCFVVSCAGNAAGSNTVDVVIVAGGGGTDSASGPAGPSGGGGGGGVAYRTSTPVSAATFPVTVGGGGAAGGTPQACVAARGSDSGAFSLTAKGGGGSSHNPSVQGSVPGGSGAGAGYTPAQGPGSATQPSQNPGVSNLNNYGNAGGTNPSSPIEPHYASAGGGGAGAAGSNAVSSGISSGANGGIGVGPPTIPWMPTSLGDSGYFAGGGGGSTQDCTSPVPGGTGGSGGGGNGGATNAQGQAGTANTGGGAGGTGARLAGGSCSGAGSAGGSGIVVIRYKYQN